MQPTIKQALIAAALVTGAAGVSGQSFAQLSQPMDIEGRRVASRIIAETNKYRAAQGSAPVKANDALMQAAQRYADYLARTHKDGHRADGRSPGQRIAAIGYNACAWSENLYEARPVFIDESLDVEGLPAKAMEFWKPSPGHQKNLRSARMNHIGVGVAAWMSNGAADVRIVQVFADDCGRTQAPKGWACTAGYVPRLAGPADRVCVTPESQALVARENRKASLQLMPGGGAYGANTCLPGLLWREAFDGDVVCVTPARRTEVKRENQLASSRVG
jgi:uncharacterized protein YkwD